MSIDFSKLDKVQRLLFEIPLEPLQGARFQPTGFPNLGAATFRSPKGECLLVESVQSMSNRLELTVWDEVKNDVKAELTGLSHIRVERKGSFLTDSIIEAHRINSPYILREKNTDKSFSQVVNTSFAGATLGPINRHSFARFLLKYDVGSLLHGVFISQSIYGGGRLRIPRALTAFIEAEGVRMAGSGGVKNDHVHPAKVADDKEKRFGNIPYARDEYTAEQIKMYFNLDIAQIKGYGLGDEVNKMLILLALFKLRSFITEEMRLRSACFLKVMTDYKEIKSNAGFTFSDLDNLTLDLEKQIKKCSDLMSITTVTFDDDLKKASEKEDIDDEDPSDTDEDNGV